MKHEKERSYNKTPSVNFGAKKARSIQGMAYPLTAHDDHQHQEISVVQRHHHGDCCWCYFYSCVPGFLGQEMECFTHVVCLSCKEAVPQTTRMDMEEHFFALMIILFPVFLVFTPIFSCDHKSKSQ